MKEKTKVFATLDPDNHEIILYKNRRDIPSSSLIDIYQCVISNLKKELKFTKKNKIKILKMLDINYDDIEGLSLNKLKEQNKYLCAVCTMENDKFEILKCCSNCSHSKTDCSNLCCSNFSKWENEDVNKLYIKQRYSLIFSY